MKLSVRLTKTYIEECTIEVDNFHDAFKEIKTLTNDDFKEVDSYFNVEVYNEKFIDVTGEIQPHALNISL